MRHEIPLCCPSHCPGNHPCLCRVHAVSWQLRRAQQGRKTAFLHPLCAFSFLPWNSYVLLPKRKIAEFLGQHLVQFNNPSRLDNFYRPWDMRYCSAAHLTALAITPVCAKCMPSVDSADGRGGGLRSAHHYTPQWWCCNDPNMITAKNSSSFGCLCPPHLQWGGQRG